MWECSTSSSMMLSAADHQLAVSADRVIGHQAKPCWYKPRPHSAAGCSSLDLQSQLLSFSALQLVPSPWYHGCCEALVKLRPLPAAVCWWIGFSLSPSPVNSWWLCSKRFQQVKACQPAFSAVGIWSCCILSAMWTLAELFSAAEIAVTVTVTADKYS